MFHSVCGLLMYITVKCFSLFGIFILRENKSTSFQGHKIKKTKQTNTQKKQTKTQGSSVDNLIFNVQCLHLLMCCVLCCFDKSSPFLPFPMEMICVHVSALPPALFM